jgi:FG-GAP repeat
MQRRRRTIFPRLAPVISAFCLISGWSTLSLASSANGTSSYQEEAKISSPTGRELNGFGRAVDIYGDLAIVGAIGSGGGGGPFNASYVFQRTTNGWDFEQELVPSSVQATVATYGISVAIDDTQAIVGADLNGEIQWQSGSVYVFNRESAGYVEVQKIFHPELTYDGNFGHSISLQGNTMIVGAPGLTGGTPPPAAYAFVRQAGVWSLQQKLTPTISAGTIERYGTSVAVDGDFAVIGDDGGFSQGFNNRGDARIFMRTDSSWRESQLLSAFDSYQNQDFGAAVSISGDTIAVGAPGGGNSNNLPGSVYIYRFDGANWNFEQRLRSSSARGGDSFGESLSLDGNRLVVGQQANSQNPAGSAYVFERQGSVWQLASQLTSADGRSNDYFGSSVALDGSQFIVGASRALPHGAAYVFLPEPASLMSIVCAAYVGMFVVRTRSIPARRAGV